MTEQKIDFRSTLQDIGNLLGGPTAHYAPQVEFWEMKQRIYAAVEIIKNALSTPEGEKGQYGNCACIKSTEGVYTGYCGTCGRKIEKPAPVLATEEELRKAITKILNDPIYSDSHTKMWVLCQDRDKIAEVLAKALVGKVAVPEEGYLAEYQAAFSLLNDANKKIAELEEWKRKVRKEAPNDRAED
jgi:hypothetical protein